MRYFVTGHLRIKFLSIIYMYLNILYCRGYKHKRSLYAAVKLLLCLCLIPSEWQCKSCTVMNQGSSILCEVCERPRLATRPPVAPLLSSPGSLSDAETKVCLAVVFFSSTSQWWFFLPGIHTAGVWDNTFPPKKTSSDKPLYQMSSFSFIKLPVQ